MVNIILVLDNLRSSHNVGSIIRSAVSFGVNQFISVGTTPYPPLESDTRLPHVVSKTAKRIEKTSLGAEKHASFSYLEMAGDCVELLCQRQMSIVVLEQTYNSCPLTAFEPVSDIALVVGNEVDGVSREFIDSAEAVVEIVHSGPKESLNVSVATGIALYELTK